MSHWQDARSCKAKCESSHTQRAQQPHTQFCHVHSDSSLLSAKAEILLGHTSPYLLVGTTVMSFSQSDSQRFFTGIRRVIKGVPHGPFLGLLSVWEDLRTDDIKFSKMRWNFVTTRYYLL